MLLHIHINKKEWCPDNINFEISFYETANDAFRKGLSLMKKCTDRMKGEFRRFEPIWQGVTKDVGDHYQIVKLMRDKEIYLNQFCEQLEPKVWFASNKE